MVLCVLARQFGITITERKLPVTRIQEEEWKFYGKIQLSEIRCTCEYYSHIIYIRDNTQLIHDITHELMPL